MRETNLESMGPFQRYESSVAEALASPRSVILDVCVYSLETTLQRSGILAVGSHRPGLESQPCHFLALYFAQIASPPLASISESVDEDENKHPHPPPHRAAQGIKYDGGCKVLKPGIRNPGSPLDIRKHRGCSSDLPGSHCKLVQVRDHFQAFLTSLVPSSRLKDLTIPLGCLTRIIPWQLVSWGF